MTDVVIVNSDSPPSIVIVDGSEVVVDVPQGNEVAIVEIPTEPIVVVESPVQGPPGIQGPAGPIGPAGPALPTWSADGPLSVVTGTHRLYMFNAGVLSAIRATVGTAAQGADLVVEIVKNSLTVIATLTIPGGQLTVSATPSAALAANDYLTVNITQVGSTVPGSDLVVQGEIVQA